MATQIVQLNGKNYTVTIVPETGERGLDVGEIFSLLPSAFSALCPLAIRSRNFK